MATVSKQIADRIIAGEYAEDECNRIVRYKNAWGGFGYGATFHNEDKERYLYETEYVMEPVIYWDPDLGIDVSEDYSE